MAYAVPPAGAKAGTPAGSTPYGYGSASNTGIRSKLCRGTGVGSCHSGDFECHGFGSAGSRLNSSDQTTLTRKTAIEIAITYAEIETQSLSVWRFVG